MKKILIVDDERQMQALISFCIKSSDFDVNTASSGQDAINLLEEKHFDLMLLDIMMPEMDGFQVLKILNQSNVAVPVIILSAVGETDSIVEGLNLGAYDYITKPFEPKELVARVNSVLRRVQPLVDKTKIRSMYGLTLDQLNHTVTYNRKIITFTKKEYQLFSRLFAQPGRVYTRELLFSLEWEDFDDKDYRNVDAHIKNIREKLKQAGVKNPVIETVWGVGYRTPQHEEVK
ncbi:response regulator transcription factor [Alkalihalobacillus deserti]|uniref:response regulator transcription factor n=1 Tax=Alkalihalobacillus deserti TaxID=2879466 RepID=UPI001D14404E|nr:response regulator transcription factor [Alkalihalobacillus deserti]